MSLTIFLRKVFTLITFVSCIIYFTGCNHYFKPVAINGDSTETKEASLRKLANTNKYFILRKQAFNFYMKDMVLDEANMTITSKLSRVPEAHWLYINAQDNDYKIPKKGRPEDELYREVHIFTNDTAQIDTSQTYTLSLSSVEKIEVIQHDKKRSTSSYVWGIVGITLGAGLVILGITALIDAATPEPQPSTPSSSCPYISTFNGTEYKLQGEIYSGAIYPNLQKDDYLPVKMTADNARYQLKISNDLKEIQYTDFADLLVAEHSENIRLLIDPQGKMHSVQQPVPIEKALLNGRADMVEELSKVDYNSCLFKDGSGASNKEDLYLSFKNKPGNAKAKLILSARSSSWFTYLYNEFTKGFGSHYNKWAKEQEQRPAAELEKWSNDQYIPLTISIKSGNNWKEVNKLETIGPLLNREVVIPLELTGDENVDLKITAGYLFWELDYAAIDFTEDAPFTIRELKPVEAINEKGISVLNELKYNDKKYLRQPDVGDSTIIKYIECSPAQGMAQTFFLHTSGYYNHPRDHKGTPKIAFLKSFEQPGALSAFSKRIFQQPLQSLELAKK